MRSFTTVDLLRNLKSVTHVAAREPVGITQHRQVRFVLMAVEDYDALAARANVADGMAEAGPAGLTAQPEPRYINGILQVPKKPGGPPITLELVNALRDDDLL